MSQSPAPFRIRPLRWILLALLTLGIVAAGLPATSASAVADGLVTGTVTFHGPHPDRTLEVYRRATDGTWAADPSRTTTVAPDGHYAVQVPTGEAVKLRMAYGEHGYWYGDGFDDEAATPVEAEAGATVSDIDLELPVPVDYSGRLLDRTGRPVSGRLITTVNTDGGSRPLLSQPVRVSANGQYHVTLPARYGGGWYENGILAFAGNDNVGTWLLGGQGSEPDWYLNPMPGQVHTNEDIRLPVDAASVMPGTSRPSVHLRATGSPVVHGVVRRGHRLHSTAGSWNRRPARVRYQWLRNGRSIRGATSATYRLRRADVHKHIRVRVTGIRDGVKVHVTSARTVAVRGH